jgi:hypothetical protein
MTRPRRIWLISGLAVLACACLLVTAAVVKAVLFPYPSGPIPPEHNKLVDDLERGKKFSKLEEISPAPDAVYGPRESPWYHPRGRYFLQYRLPDGRNLIIILDENLGMIDHNLD